MKKRKRKSSLEPGSFSEVFRARLDKLGADAKSVGANLTILCKMAKISRAGPTRWNDSIPLTIKTIDKLERALKKFTEKAKMKAESGD